MRFSITAFNVFSSLHNRNYRFLWFATLFNITGQWIQLTTLGWLVWKLSESAMVVGVTIGLRVIPYLFMGPVTGVIADRIDRRRILMFVQITMAAMSIFFAVVVGMGEVRVWHAMLFSFAMGCGFTMCGPLLQALVANTVAREGLGNAIALSAMAFNVSRVVGPAIGGILIVSIGAAGNFMLQAFLFLGVIAMIFPMKTPFRATETSGQSSIFKCLHEGISYIWHDKTLLSLIILSYIPAFCVMPISNIMPAFTGEVLHADANVYGYLMASFGIGGLLATLYMASFSVAVRGGWLGLLSLGCTTAIIIWLSQSTLPWVAFLLYALIGFSQVLFRVNNNTLVQMLSPDSLRGRITSIYQMDQAFTLLASFALGGIADVFSVPTAIAISGGIGLLSIILLFSFVRSIRNLRNLSI